MRTVFGCFKVAMVLLASLLLICDCRQSRSTRGGARSSSELARKIGLVWVALPAGSFMMGSSHDPDESPVHSVALARFAMLKTEVTSGQYGACVGAGGCTEARVSDNCRKGRGASHPVTCVEWKQARAFCAWAGGRLPAEAEWEYAARSGGKAQSYPWGNAPADCSRAVMQLPGKFGCGRMNPWPVCSKPAGNSAQGLCDLAGNVWEWTRDCAEAGYRDAPANNSARTKCSPKHGGKRVLRGGAWNYTGRELRATHRNWTDPTEADRFTGFRCAKTL